jgi:hypothetical protein
MAEVGKVVGSVTDVNFPEMRDEVRSALESLSDRDYQQRVWIEHRLPQPSYYDELKLEIHILFDDIDVCVDPDRWVGDVLFPAEVEPLRHLGQALDALLADPDLVTDADYLADPRWAEVIRQAQVALAVMNRLA